MLNEQRLIDRFLKYITCDSESKNERAFCLMVEDELTRMGIKFERDEVGHAFGSNGWNIIASIPGKGEPILLSAHLDTVLPGVGIRPVIQDGIIRSSGDTILGADDKSGIAAALEALESLMEDNLEHRPVELMFSLCEELGLLGAKYADYAKLQSREAIVLDGGPFGSVINRQPCHEIIHVTIHGKASHAGSAPEKGIHALKAAAMAIDRIPCGHVDDITVMNVANLISPGRSNIVPDLATFDMEIRSFERDRLNEHIENAKAAIREACERFGATCELSFQSLGEPFHVKPDSDLIKKVIAAHAKLGAEVEPKRSFGGCDATWTSANGISSVCIGTGSNGAHGVEERIAIDDLVKATRVVISMITSA